MALTMTQFEVTIYNKDVRKDVQNNKRHPHYDDGWADQRFITVEARDKDRAHKLITRRHPEHKGFVIVDITEIPNYQ